jgi:hypothetical protein
MNSVLLQEIIRRKFNGNPDSRGSLDPNPDPNCGSGSKRAKMTQKNRKQLIKSIF